jgi:glycosyltransferase involved in cell wall biosynthesis
MLRRTRHGRKIITVHGHDLQPFLESRLPLIPRVTRWSLARFDLVVAVSDEVANTLRQHLPEALITILPAYLPPMLGSPKDETSDGQPEDRTLVVAAYNIRLLASGDLYGLDVALGAFERLADTDPSLRLLILLAKAPRRPRARRYLRARLESLDEQSRRRVSLKIGHSLTDNLRPGAIYLRPTRIDGDAVSIREALTLGIPVAASDVVHRPQGTRLVAGYGLTTWTNAIADMLCQQPTSNASATVPTLFPNSDDEASAVLALYGEHTSSNRHPKSRKSPGE